MKKLFQLFMIACVVIGLSACAVSPRTSNWTSPKKFTQAQVFSAAAVAGGQIGYATSVIDKDSGALSFSRVIGKGTMTLSVAVSTVDSVVHVSTTANYTDIGIAGIHEEEIKKLHSVLFRNLKIDEGEVNNLVIKEAI